MRKADQLHADIMALQPHPPALPHPSDYGSYREGHREARHAAAELVRAALGDGEDAGDVLKELVEAQRHVSYCAGARSGGREANARLAAAWSRARALVGGKAK